MEIKRLTASFGKLNNESIKFHSGLNVIEAPNESGKSTWCAFIKAMLYGVDSSERAKAGHIPDKQRYMPWSGIPMEGTMELTADGCDITISRSTKTAGAPMRDFSACYTGTAIKVPELNSSNSGELLTGVSKEVFCRSAFVEQGGTAVTGSAELEKRIQSVLSTGEEETSYTEAENRLKGWQRKRKFNRRGTICELEEGIAAVREDINGIAELSDAEAALETKLEQCRAETAELETGLSTAQTKQKQELISKVSSISAENERLSKEYDAALSELSTCKERLRANVVGSINSNSPDEEAAEDIEEIERLSATPKGLGYAWISGVLLLLSIAGAAVYKLLLNNIAVIIAAGAVCIAAVVFIMIYARHRQTYRTALGKIETILKKYGAQSVSQIEEKIEEYWRLKELEAEAEQNVGNAYEALKDSKERMLNIQQCFAEGLDYDSGSPGTAEISRALSAKRDEEIRLVAEISALNAKIRTAGDPAVLNSELNEMLEKKALAQSEYDAISLAVETLSQANDEIQSRFSPRLGKTAAEYFNFLTGGKYEDVLVDRSFNTQTRAAGESVAHDSGFLSAGTSDCMYLSVRLAVCKLALPSEEPCPLIIDDALVNLDGERYAKALKLLLEIAKERQVILFTCRQQKNS